MIDEGGRSVHQSFSLVCTEKCEKAPAHLMAASVESSVLALVRASSDASPLFAHQIGEELSRTSGGSKAGALDLRIASSTGAPLYVWSFPPLLFNALVRLGSRGDISFLPVSAVEAKMSLLGVKAKHPPLIATGADLSKPHMIPLRVVPGIVVKSGAFHFVGADETSTRFDWNTGVPETRAVKKPVTAAKKPAAAAKKPAAAAKKPVTAVKKPAAAAKKPVTAAKKPAVAVKKPAVVVKKPASAATSARLKSKATVAKIAPKAKNAARKA